MVGRTLAVHVKNEGGVVLNYLPFLWTVIGIGKYVGQQTFASNGRYVEFYNDPVTSIFGIGITFFISIQNKERMMEKENLPD